MSTRRFAFARALTLIVLSAGGAFAAGPPPFVYALQQVDGGTNQIHGFRLDPVTGALTSLPGFPIGSGGTGTSATLTEAIAYANGRLYVLNTGSKTLSIFFVNRATGALTELPISTIPLSSAERACIAVHPNGSLVVLGRANGGLDSWVVSPTSAALASGSPFTTGAAQPFSCRFSQNGNYVYTGGNNGSSIAGFIVTNASTGVLTPLSGSPFNSGGGNPMGYATDSSGRLFAVNLVEGHVRAFTTTGGVPTGVAGNPFASGISQGVHGVLHPGGFYLVADRENRVGVYRVTGSGSGTTLSAVTGSPFDSGGAFTNVLTITLDGGLLAAANSNSRNLTMFRVDAASGGLTLLGVQPANTLGATGFITGLALVPAPTHSDFDGDQEGDLFWRHKTSGQNVAWLMDGTTVSNSALLPTIASTNWEVKGFGDFDASSKGDVIWRNRVNGQNAIWLMNGLTVAFSTFLPTIANTNWEIKGVGDVDADAKADVIWRNRTTGQNIVWLMNGATVSTSAFLPTIADTNWEIKGAGDFDGDGKADVVLRNKATGENIAWLMNGTAVSSSAFLPMIADTNWDIKGVGDLDGDGKADVIWRNTGTGENIAWLMNAMTVATSAFLPTIANLDWEIKALRDLDGDGHADVVWRKKVTGENLGWLMNGVVIKQAAFIPTISDLNWEIPSQ